MSLISGGTPAVLIIGAGPCGIACLRALDTGGDRSAHIIEAASEPGGLGGSTVDPNGFTWDRGGHVVFSHHGEFDRLLAEVLGNDVWHHDRSSWVLADGAWVPYPFQNNLRHLDPDRAFECLVGLIEAGTGSGTADQPDDIDFASWIRATFGPGIERHFMVPYNEKVWATDPADMSARWISERVSVTDWRPVLARMLAGEDDLGWGPNNRFAFPATGGTGEIWRRAAAPLSDRISYETAVESIDVIGRVVHTSNGGRHPYEHLVSTMPIDLLVAAIPEAPRAVVEAAESLVHSTVHVVGVGYEAPLTDDRSWLYFADPDIAFYRATNFAKYSPANVPGADTGRYSSWMCEVSSSLSHPRDLSDIGAQVDADLRRTGVVTGDPPIASIHVEGLPYAYPVPTRSRDAALAVIQPWLAEQGISSRGRFGTWRYEIGNMDHAVKMGIDVANRLLHGTPEELV